MDDLEKQIARGQRAQQLLEEPLIAEAFDALKAEYMRLWENTKSRDVEAREKLWHHARAADAVKQHLLSVMTTGKLAKQQKEVFEATRKSWFQRA